MSTQNSFRFPEWNCEYGRYEADKAEVIVRELTRKDSRALQRFEDSFGRMSKFLSYEIGCLKSKQKTIERRTKKGGKLNPRYVQDELKRIYAGQELSQKIYDRRITKSCDEEDYTGTIIGLLVDQSGSTRFQTEDGHRRIDLIKYAALTLGRSLNEAEERFFMYSFHSDAKVYPTYLETLKGITEPWSESLESKISALEHTADTSEFNNVDGSAIRYMNESMKKYSKAKKIVFMLTDGNPNAENSYGEKLYYSNDYAFQDTMKAMEEGKSKGIEYVYLTINPESSADKFLGVIEHTTSYCKRYSKMSEVVEGLTRVYEKMQESKPR